MQFTEGHQFCLELAKILVSGVVQVVGAVALYRSSPRKKEGET